MNFSLTFICLLLTLSSLSQSFIGKCIGYEQFWQDTSGTYHPNTKGLHLYDNQGYLQRVITNTWNGTSWVLELKDTIVYNGSGEIVLHETFNYSSGVWIPNRKTEWTFNALNLATEETRSYWNNGNYQAQLKWENYYTGYAKDSTLNFSDFSGTGLKLGLVSVFTNNSSNYPINEDRYTFSGGMRNHTGTLYYSYHSNGLLDKVYTVGDCFINGIYDTCTIQTYYFNSLGRDTLILRHELDTNSGIILAERIRTVFDSNQNEILNTIEQPVYGVWGFLTKAELHYDLNYMASDIMYPNYLTNNFHITNKVDWLKSFYENGSPWPSRDSTFYIHNSFISLDEHSSKLFSVYPNPFEGKLTVSNDGRTSFKIELIDAMGKVIYATTTTGLDETIDLSHISNGIYTLRVIAENNNIVEYFKLIKTDSNN